jgi:predicted transcriptional regulator
MNNFQLVRLAEGDAKQRTDHLHLLKELLLRNSPMYPSIDRWFSDKVLPGLRSSERIAYIGYVDETPVVSAVVKRGESSKFCHLRIDPSYQDQNLGELFFALMALEVKNSAQQIHFTLPESLWCEKQPFFESFGFQQAIKHEIQYRLFDPELYVSASFETVWQSVLQKLHKFFGRFDVGGHSLNSEILLSIKPDHADRILNGEKTVEIRTRFSKKWIGTCANIYASTPVSGLVGTAKISNIKVGSPKRIWNMYASHLGCSREAFYEYTKDHEQVYAIELNEPRRYHAPVTISYASRLVGEDLTPPQSYCMLEHGRPWAKAVSLATLLHGLRTRVVRAPLRTWQTKVESRDPQQMLF